MTKKSSGSKVAIQKGPINPSPKVNKTMSYNELVSEGKERRQGITGMQECKLKEPKR